MPDFTQRNGEALAKYHEPRILIPSFVTQKHLTFIELLLYVRNIISLKHPNLQGKKY